MLILTSNLQIKLAICFASKSNVWTIVFSLFTQYMKWNVCRWGISRKFGHYIRCSSFVDWLCQFYDQSSSPDACNKVTLQEVQLWMVSRRWERYWHMYIVKSQYLELGGTPKKFQDIWKFEILVVKYFMEMCLKCFQLPTHFGISMIHWYQYHLHVCSRNWSSTAVFYFIPLESLRMIYIYPSKCMKNKGILIHLHIKICIFFHFEFEA